jgi:hypothetical protein
MPCSSQYRLFLLLGDFRTVALLAALLDSVTRGRLARRAVRSVVCLILLPTSLPPCRSLHRTFHSLVEVSTGAPLAASLVYFSYRRLARRAARWIARFFLFTTPSPTSRSPRRSQHRLFLSLADVLPATPLAASLVSSS